MDENQKAIEYFQNIIDNMTIDKKAAAFIKLAIEALEKHEILNKKFSNAEPDFCLTEGFTEEEVKKICEDALYRANELREEKLMLLKQNVANQKHALKMASNTQSTNIAMQGFGQMANALWGTSFNVSNIDYEGTNDAYNMAIKALQTEPCGKDINVPATDAISRSELLKAIDTWDKFGYWGNELIPLVSEDGIKLVPYIHYDDVVKCIKSMPPVQPELNCRNCVFRMGYDRH